MRIVFLLLLILLIKNCLGQKSMDLSLKAQLKVILQNDQGIREFLDTSTPEVKKDSICKLLNYPRAYLSKNSSLIMHKIDSINLAIVEEIISKFGYPGKTLVGSPENTAVFYVIQHSEKISKYYPLIKKAGADNELPFLYVAMMLDRLLVRASKEQIYGSQIISLFNINPETGKEEEFSYVAPIKDPKNVNKRRQKAGFKTTVEENAAKFGVSYKVYTYELLKKLKGK